jgi:hypothetical protein
MTIRQTKMFVEAPQNATGASMTRDNIRMLIPANKKILRTGERMFSSGCFISVLELILIVVFQCG